MAFIMIILFMGGFLFTVSGTLGDDLVNVVSYLTSKDNLEGDDTIILGNVKQYLNQCFNYDGKILTQLGLLDNKIEPFEKLKNAKIELEELKSQFEDKNYKFVYNEFKYQLEQRKGYNSADLELIPSSGDNINFFSILRELNVYTDANGQNENWDITTTTSPNDCGTEPPHESKIIYHPSKCFPLDKSWISSSSDSTITALVTKLAAIKNVLDSCNIEATLDNLGNTYYNTFLTKEIETLEEYINKIKVFTELVKQYTSEDDDLFSFMNCRFVKDNVDVILHYLKHSFQNDIYEVGIYLLIAAFALPFGISLTILLIMISNDEIESNKKKEIENKEKERRKSLKNMNNINNINNINNTNNISPIQVEANKNDGNNTEQRPLNNNNPN